MPQSRTLKAWSVPLAIAAVLGLAIVVWFKDMGKRRAPQTVQYGTTPRPALDPHHTDVPTADQNGSPADVPRKPFAIWGRVVDDSGAPVKGAHIASFPELGKAEVASAERARPLAVTTSNDDGIFTMGVGTGERRMVVVRQQGFRMAKRLCVPLRGSDTDTPEGWRLERGRAITGKVLAVDYGPIPGARVLATGRGLRYDAPGATSEECWGPEVDAASGTTDGDGRFVIGGLGQGVYALHVASAGFMRDKDYEEPVLASSGDDVTITVVPTLVANFILVDSETGCDIGTVESVGVRAALASAMPPAVCPGPPPRIVL